jgi:predicted transcriptional regulator
VSKTTMGVKLDDEIRGRLKALAEARRRSTHWLMKEAIGQYLEREEAIERRNREADEAWEECRATGRSVSHDAMSAWLESWGRNMKAPAPSPNAEAGLVPGSQAKRAPVAAVHRTP